MTHDLTTIEITSPADRLVAVREALRLIVPSFRDHDLVAINPLTILRNKGWELERKPISLRQLNT